MNASSATRKTAIVSTLGLIAAAVVLALLAARLAASLQRHWAPLVLFPLLCGGVLGCTIAWVQRRFSIPTRSDGIVAALLAGLVFSLAQHYFVYRDYVAAYEQTRRKNPAVELLEQARGDVRAMNFRQFMSHSAARGRQVGSWHVGGWGAWSLWTFEAMLATAAAIGAARFFTASTPDRSCTPSVHA
jgi:hypothetical protein